MKTETREIEVEALVGNLPRVFAFVDRFLADAECPTGPRRKLRMVVDEVFTNIVSYAYGGEVGKAALRIGIEEDPRTIVLTFTDSGIPFNPLEREDPDIALSPLEKPIGGLGIYMTKTAMDDMHYEYRDGKNILTLKKKL